MSDTVLVIEDDPDVGLALRILLTRAGFEVHLATAGREGLRLFHEIRPAAVVLDLGLPDIDGWGVLERIRDLSTRPVLVLTAEGGDPEKVRGLRSGADDYLTKPFSNAELVARIEALIRRSRLTVDDERRPSTVIGSGALRVDRQSGDVAVDGDRVDLSPLEFRLLEALVSHPDRTLSPVQLIQAAWGDSGEAAPERVKFTMLRLRRKLGDRVVIESVRGFGYRYLSDPIAGGAAT